MIGELALRAEEIRNRFSEVWTLDTRDLARPAAEKVLENLIQQSPAAMTKRLTLEFFGFGPLETLCVDEEITEIIVNGPAEIWIEREGHFSRYPDRFLTPFTFKNAIDRICSECSINLDLAEPFADGRWRGFRVHLACAPLVNASIHLSLRRISHQPWTFERLMENEWARPDQIAKIRGWLAERKNILFIGPTGSGKTSVLSAALQSLNANERVVILEDTDEIPPPNSASTKLLTRSTSTPSLRDVTLTELVKQSLRMRPQRLVVGEVRGGEAKDLLLALATGHSGSMGTLHASDPHQALLRLEMLVQMGAPQWNVQAIRKLIHLSVDHFVVCGNANGHRRLVGLFKVAALESFGFLIEQI